MTEKKTMQKEKKVNCLEKVWIYPEACLDLDRAS